MSLIDPHLFSADKFLFLFLIYLNIRMNLLEYIKLLFLINLIYNNSSNQFNISELCKLFIFIYFYFFYSKKKTKQHLII